MFDLIINLRETVSFKDELPENVLDAMTALNYLKFIKLEGSLIIKDMDGKQLFSYIYNDQYAYIALSEGVSSADNISCELTPERLAELKAITSNDFMSDYKSIQVRFGNEDYGTISLRFKTQELEELTYKTELCLYYLYFYLCTNKTNTDGSTDLYYNNKHLLTIIPDGGVVLASGVTSADNISCTVTAEKLSELLTMIGIEDEDVSLCDYIKTIKVYFPGTIATGINEELRMQNEESASDVWYDLQGRKVNGNNVKNGIYIVNGRIIYAK